MIHCLSCYADAKPNEDGGNKRSKKGTFQKPECHMSAGSEAATEKLPEAFLPVKAFKIVVHTSMMIILGLFVLSLL